MIYELVKGYAGTGMTVYDPNQPADYVEQSPAEIFAATDYTAPNGTQNYMYYVFPQRNTTVSTDAVADQMDAVRANYIGVTQQAGQKLAFYQRGVLMGGPTAPTSMNVYANEIWFKDFLAVSFLNAFLALPQIPADSEGDAILTGLLQTGVDTAKTNGTIAVGKALTVQQQLYISQQTGDANAWRQVQTSGYWFRVQMLSRNNPNSGLTEYYAKYLLIYSKNDSVLKVEGQDTLI